MCLLDVQTTLQPFIGKLLSSTLLWCCLYFDFTQFVILENLSVYGLGNVRSESVNRTLLKEVYSSLGLSLCTVPGLAAFDKALNPSDPVFCCCILALPLFSKSLLSINI